MSEDLIEYARECLDVAREGVHKVSHLRAECDARDVTIRRLRAEILRLKSELQNMKAAQAERFAPQRGLIAARHGRY